MHLSRTVDTKFCETWRDGPYTITSYIPNGRHNNVGIVEIDEATWLRIYEKYRTTRWGRFRTDHVWALKRRLRAPGFVVAHVWRWRNARATRFVERWSDDT